MPRKTAKSKAKNCNAAARSDCVPKRSCATKISRNGNEKVKSDLVVETAKETVFHRKSERRRIARDIFLVFEEESNTRRKTRGTNKKNAKPKFGHLNVDDHIKPKGLLRDIKNEPRCYINGNSLSVNSSLATVPIIKCNANVVSGSNEERKTKSERIKSGACKSMNTSFSSNIKNLKESQYCTIESNSVIAARVNPIFLWVKQDDTRIVEVRCEDYDKRNRIRITKTTNGWRAIPRSDPTSSRVLKFYPTPLMKVKREIISEANRNSNHIELKNIGCNNYSTQNLLSINVNEIDTKLKEFDSKYNSLPPKINKIKKKKSKKKKKSHSRKSSKKSDTPTMKTFNSTEIKNTSDEIYNNIRYECKNIEEDSTNLEVIDDKPKNVNTFITDVQSELGTTYQKESFHLCPKTGLFLLNSNISIPQYNSENVCQNESSRNDEIIVKNCFNITKDVNVAAEKNINEPKIHINDETTESLEAKTRNLKDLLDDDNLLQHCDENANSDAELIDSLVKTSCENNLIQANEVLTKVSMDHIPHKADNEMVVQLITEVSDPPNCLSFNEAGEIEGLNGDLFQPNTFNETYDKQINNGSCEQQIALHSTTTVAATSAMTQRSSTCDNIESNTVIMDKDGLINIIDDSPKDLSYKKREEVCPPSESRSQCAVTSSSDVIESPQHENSSLKATSETLKNLILEQFIKLNALSSQHQTDPIDLGKQRHTDISDIKSLYGSKSVSSNNLIETVVIEDDEDDKVEETEQEPLKKRLRINNKPIKRSISKICIDKDPDPLTQLRLLIGNTQWKVPDPILVPKDRLSAVLASPAREIPLLITTRPELRLPEAFAYPEIIQNPNILVISMAQLEAILKNEHENESTSCKGIENGSSLQDQDDENITMQLSEHLTSLQTQPTRQFLLEHQTKNQNNILNNSTNKPIKDQLTIEISSREENKNAKCSQTESSLSSDVNSEDMSMLNQMFWLPYFGNISQDVMKSFNSPILLQEKFSNIIPILNSHLHGLTNLDDIFKNKNFGQSASHNDSQTFKQKLGTSEELSIFQKIVQRQMQSVLQLNQLKKNYSRFSETLEADKSITALEKANPNNIDSSHNIVEQKKQKLLYPNNIINSNNQSNNCNTTFVGERSYNLRSSVAGRQSSDNKQYSNSIQRRNADNKPRLTCKSLSNLLDPEYGIPPSSNASCRQQFPEKGSTTDYNLNEKVFDGNEKNLRDTLIVPPSARSCSNTNLNIESSNNFNKEKSKTIADSIRKENNSTNSDMSGISADTNIPLWHPLFGSNKTAYSSPWQWTTVTATGE